MPELLILNKLTDFFIPLPLFTIYMYRFILININDTLQCYTSYITV